jgi:hypothetical protein
MFDSHFLWLVGYLVGLGVASRGEVHSVRKWRSDCRLGDEGHVASCGRGPDAGHNP